MMRFLPILLGALLLSASINAQDTPTPPAALPPPEAAVKRDWALSQLDAAKKQEASLDEKALREQLQKAGLPQTYADDFLNAVHETARNYQAASDILTSVLNSQRTLDDLANQPDPAVPQTDEQVDAFRDRITALRQQLETAGTQLELDDSVLTRNQSTLEAARQQSNRAAEELATAATPEARTRAGLQMKLADLRQQAASSAVFLSSWKIALPALDQQISAASLHKQEKALSDSGLDTLFSKNRAESALERLAKSREAALKQREESRGAAKSFNDTAAALTKDADAAKDPEKNLAVAKQNIASEVADIANRLVQTQEDGISRLGIEENSWRAALAVTEKESAENLQKMRDLAEDARASLDPWRTQLRRSLQDTQRRLQEVLAAPLSRDASVRKLEEARRDLLQRWVAVLTDLSTTLETQFSTEEQLLSESRERLAAQSLVERASLTFEQGWTGVRSIWDWQLFQIQESVSDDHGNIKLQPRPVTLGKLTIALLFLIFGVVISKLISRRVSSRVERRFAIDATRSESLEKAIFFVLFCGIVLSLLGWLHISLTAFAFLGGALAIGVGFGAQTLVNNFISGLILLAERRIKVGDIIEVDTHTGSVINLGTRCSRISKGNGVEVLIPNSYLLEKNVANWTITGSRHRYDFSVGLAYGSSTEQAIALLQRAVDAEEKVLKDPRPRVFLEDFGAAAIIFRIFYWVDLRSVDNNEIGSNIRLRIEKLCTENNLALQMKQPGVVQLTSPGVK